MVRRRVGFSARGRLALAIAIIAAFALGGASARGADPYTFTEETFTGTVLAEQVATTTFNFQMLEDGNGTIHAFFIDAERKIMHTFREDGNWSSPKLVLPATRKDDAGFDRPMYNFIHAALTPDGEPCVVYDSWGDNALYLAKNIGGDWESFAIKEAGGMMDMMTITSFDTARPFFGFDGQGEPRYLYTKDFKALYLNDIKLTEFDYLEYTDPESGSYVQEVKKGILPGLGGDIIDPVLTIAPDGVCHLDYFSFERMQVTESGDNQNLYKYLYSTSADGGETWEGPFEVCGDVPGDSVRFPNRSVVYDADGTKCISLFQSWQGRVLTIARVPPGGEMSVERHFDSQANAGNWDDDPLYQQVVSTLSIGKMVAARDGMLHFYGDAYPNACHLALSRDGEWHITLAAGLPNCFVFGMLPREDGETIVYLYDIEKEAFCVYTNR